MASCNYVASCGDDIKFWNHNSLLLEKQLPFTQSSFKNVSWSQDGMQLASIPTNENKIVLTLTKNSSFSKVDLNVNENVSCVRFMNTLSRYVGIGCVNGNVLLWDLKNQRLKQMYSVPSLNFPVTCLEFKWNDSHVAASYENGKFVLINITSSQVSSPYKLQDEQAVRCLRYNSVSKSLLGSSYDSGIVALWDTNSQKLVHKFDSSHLAPSTGLAFSPVNDKLLTSVGLDKKIVCYDIHIKSAMQSINVENPLSCIDFFRDGVTLGVGTTRGQILFYDLRNSTVPFKMATAHKGSVADLAFQKVLSNNLTKSVKRSRSKQEIEERVQHEAVALSPAPSECKSETAASKSPDVGRNRNSLTYQIFSPVHNDVRSSIAQNSNSPEYHNANSIDNTPALSKHRSTPHSQSIENLPNETTMASDATGATGSLKRHGPIGGRLQTPPSVIGIRPITAGSSESDSQVMKNIAIATNGPSSPALKNAAFSAGAESDQVDKQKSAVADPIHVIHSDFRNGDIFSPIAPSVASNHSITDKDLSHTDLPNMAIGPTPQRATKTPKQTTPAMQNNVSSQQEAALPCQSLVNKPDFDNLDKTDLNSLKLSIEAVQAQVQDVRDEIEDFKDMVHKDYMELHVTMIKEFQFQLAEIRKSMEYFSINEDLLKIIEELKRENEHLRALY